MSGGVSHMDTFDPKPALSRYAGQALEGKGDVIVRQGNPGPLMPSPFTFRKYGQSGMDVSEIFPRLATTVDELALLRSVHGQSNDHVQAHYEMSTGMIRMGFPSVGAWISVRAGVGKPESPCLRGDLRCACGGRRRASPRNRSSGFMPGRARIRGSVFRASGVPIIDLKPPDSITPEQQRDRLSLLGKLNEMDARKYPGNTELTARIASYELAYRMQGCAPEAVDINAESTAVKKLYGLDDPKTALFGKQCLMARRLVERGVRFVQLYHGGLGIQKRRYLGRA